MLKVPEFEIRNLEETMRLIKQKIPLMSADWTDTGDSDPGITVLELFAYMNMVMQKRLGQEKREHIEKYLRLLGISRRAGRPSGTIVEITPQNDEHYVLLKGSRLLAGKLFFEADNTKIIYNINIKKLFYRTEDAKVDISRIMYADNIREYLFGKDPKAGCEFYIGMDKPLWGRVNHSIYFSLDPNTYRRNPFDPDMPMDMCRIKWEYFNGANWAEAEVIKDETYGFLMDGYVSLKISDSMSEFSPDGEEPLYYIRAAIVSENLDVAPRINRVMLNAVRVSQKDTVCATIKLSGTGEAEQTYLLENALVLNEHILVEVKRSNGEWITYPVNEGAQSRCRIIIVDNTKPFLRFSLADYGVVPAMGEDNIRITVYKRGFEGDRLVSFGTGLINQVYDTEFNNVDWDSFNIASTRNTYYGKRYYEWRRIDCLADAKEDELVYEVDMELGRIKFGDGIHGAVPAEDERIMITSLAFTDGGNGNVKEGEISRFALHYENEILSVKNPFRSLGGANIETTGDTLLEYYEMKNKLSRAVSRADYKALTLQTPGLAIEKVAVWNCNEIEGFANIKNRRSRNTVYISVLPCGMREGRDFLDVYEEAILKYLDDFRLVTTKIEILRPVMAGIEIYGTIYIKEHHAVNEKEFNDRIYAYFETKTGFGEEIVPGEIYAALDGIESVEYIESIQADCRLYGCKQDKNRNLILPPNAICHVSSINLEFKR